MGRFQSRGYCVQKEDRIKGSYYEGCDFKLEFVVGLSFIFIYSGSVVCYVFRFFICVNYKIRLQ